MMRHCLEPDWFGYAWRVLAASLASAALGADDRPQPQPRPHGVRVPVPVAAIRVDDGDTIAITSSTARTSPY